MAFDPQYASNGFFFIYFTDLNGDIAIERYQVSSGDPNLANPGAAANSHHCPPGFQKS